MSEHVIIETSMDHSRKLGCHIYIADFANILKSFVGSNFLSIPFGFGLCGLTVGTIGLISIATLSVHCCHLLVKCKYRAIQHIVHLYRQPNNFSPQSKHRYMPRYWKWTDSGLNSFKLFVDHLIDPEMIKQKGNADQRKEYAIKVQKVLVKTLQYGDLARMCLGQWGVTLTNVAILITQVGFCANYAIFTANAIQSFFPVHNCTVQLQRNLSVTSPDCQYLVNAPWQPWLEKATNKSRANNSISLGYVSAEDTALSSVPEGDVTSSDSVARSDGYLTSQTHSAPSVTPNLIDSPTQKQWVSAQLVVDPYPERSILSMSSSSSSIAVIPATPSSSSNSNPHDFRILNEYSTILDSITSSKTSVSSESVMTSSSTSSSISSLALLSLRSASDQTIPPTDTPSFVRDIDDSSGSASAAEPMWNMIWSDSPDLRLLFLIPVTIFGILVLPRQIRVLGIISTFGNLALLCGTLVVLIALIAQFHMSDSWVWARMEGLPIFFGTVASAFEGAVLMLPVEASMEGNRHNFAPYLVGATTLLMLLHVCMSVLSYLAFGGDIAQVVTMNLDVGSWLGVMVNACLMVGIVFSFPLTVFPVIQLAEATFLGKGRYCCRTAENAEDKTLLLPDPHHTAIPTDSNSAILQVSRWKRNVIRIMLVLFIGMLGMFLRDSFANIAAFIGAVGSTFVAFIMPCLFHLRLCWSRLSLALKIKDLSIILLGVVFCVTGIYSVIKDMVM